MAEHPLNILLIEDERNHEALILDAFTSDSIPYHLETAFSLGEAREMMSAFEPDLIISDLILRDGKGTDLLGEDRRRLSYPLVVMTGYGDEQMAVEAMKAGVMDYVVKSPESLAAMPVIAERALRQWRHIRDRHRAEAALRDSEARYRAIVEGFDGFIYVAGEDYRIQFMNDRLIARTGYDGTGRFCYKVLHGLDEICPWCLNEQVFSGKTVRWETLSPLDNRWYFIVNTPIHHPDGKLSKQAMILDITERKQVEEALRKSEEKFSKAFRLSPDSLLITRLSDGKIIEFNESFLHTMGYEKREVMGKPAARVRNWVNYTDRESFHRLLRQEGQCGGMETRFRSRTGKLIPALISARTIELEGEECVISITRDISELKQAEAELKKHRDHLDELVRERTRELTAANEQLQKEIQDRKRMEEALKTSEYKYKTLFENLPHKIFYKDKDSVYVSCNRHFATDVKVKPDKIAGKTDFDFFPRKLAEKYRTDDKRILTSGRLEEIEEAYIQNGRERVIQTVKTPMRDEQGEIMGIQGIFWDITERKKAESENARYQELLRALSSELLLTEERERRRIAMDLHDRIGQALALSKIKLGILREKVSSPDVIREVDEIRKYIEQTINDTRSLTFEISPPVLYEFGLGAALEWLVDQVSEHHGIRIDYVDDGLPKPLTDGTSILLFRATRELLLNIIKHARANSVSVSLKREEGNLFIIVEDDGIGFKAADTRNHSDKTDGYGLFSIQERLSQLGGDMTIASETGKGTRVCIKAPLETLKIEPFGGTGERSNTSGR